MPNSKASRRSLGTAQLKLREVVLKYLGASGDTVEGFDRLLIESVTDLGAGNYVIILKGMAKGLLERGADAIMLKGYSADQADVSVQVTARDYDRITIQCAIAGVAADADVTLCLGVSDARFDLD